jgi:hypothetical protein
MALASRSRVKSQVLEELMDRMALPDWRRRGRTGDIVYVERPLLPVHYRRSTGHTRVSRIAMLRLDIDGR